MCGRFHFSSIGAYERHYGLSSVPFPLTPHYNIAPGMQVPVVIRKPGCGPAAVEMRFGLTPAWFKDPTPGQMLINARAETVAVKPAFASLLRSQRCLVPANSFFAWQQQGELKIPYNVRLLDQELFSLAGVWDIWSDGIGHTYPSFAILTTPANQLLAPIHDRMPVILRPQDEALWLDPQLTDTTPLRALFAPFPAHLMQAYPISPLVNTPRHDVPEVLTPLERYQ